MLRRRRRNLAPHHGIDRCHFGHPLAPRPRVVVYAGRIHPHFAAGRVRDGAGPNLQRTETAGLEI